MNTIEIGGNIYNVKCFDYVSKIKKTIKDFAWDSMKEEFGKDKALELLGSKDGKKIPDKYSRWYFDIGMNGDKTSLAFDTEEQANEKLGEILEKVHNYVCK